MGVVKSCQSRFKSCLPTTKLKYFSVITVILMIGPRMSVYSHQEELDVLEDFPSFSTITKIEDVTANCWTEIWQLVEEMSPEERQNRQYINDILWPQILSLLVPSYRAIKAMDNKIAFKRKPSGLMDALLRVTSLVNLQSIASSRGKSKFDELVVRFFEVSSAASQMHRFYTKRIRDIMSDEPKIGMVANSIFNYKCYVWGISDWETAFFRGEIQVSASLADEKICYENSTRNIFQGLRELLSKNPDIVLKAQFDGKICEGNDTIFNIDPAGLDVPYYVLFHLCMVDIKFFSLLNFAYMYNEVYRGQIFQGQADLRATMRRRVQHKIDKFDEAFGTFLNNTGPSYDTYPGIGVCDPAPTDEDNRTRTWVIGKNFEKLTNFIKVFVAPEQQLHKGGNCKQTCDMLDGTYQPCSSEDTDCLLDDEMECFIKKSQCDAFDPPCPPGQYQCQNATSVMTVCPSNRPDRLYEYIKGHDYFLGNEEQVCENGTMTYKGGWLTEQDVLVDTPHFCEICACYCFEPLVPFLGEFTIRYMNGGLKLSLWRQGFIIVGVKFERIEDQIHIRVAEAKIAPNRQVDASTINWVKIQKQTDRSKLIRLNKDLRSVNLDDVVSDTPDRIVTGVGMYSGVYQGAVQYQYMGVQILTHKINFDTLTFAIGSGKLRLNKNSTAFRTRYNYADDPDGPDEPLNAQGPALPDTTSNQYCVFVGTSLNKDAAQSTIPYFDAQKVIRPNPKWLKGIGIYHKSRPHFGGFLALKLIEHGGESDGWNDAED